MADNDIKVGTIIVRFTFNYTGSLDDIAKIFYHEAAMHGHNPIHEDIVDTEILEVHKPNEEYRRTLK